MRGMFRFHLIIVDLHVQVHFEISSPPQDTSFASGSYSRYQRSKKKAARRQVERQVVASRMRSGQLRTTATSAHESSHSEQRQGARGGNARDVQRPRLKRSYVTTSRIADVQRPSAVCELAVECCKVSLAVQEGNCGFWKKQKTFRHQKRQTNLQQKWQLRQRNWPPHH